MESSDGRLRYTSVYTIYLYAIQQSLDIHPSTSQVCASMIDLLLPRDEHSESNYTNITPSMNV